ncbi:hypothetical protein SKAU_G00073650 [Synaphobranchus kaupii]|uniref:Uncharacterized protein n=1 Tax=Synaphobranchus kaupii TaxID=118154 RepID=A0A9Q1JBY5_SYNKA|nr:hypothetical protein SKAU_G00073650 [Synaphobranchus kaupii]
MDFISPMEIAVRDRLSNETCKEEVTIDHSKTSPGKYVLQAHSTKRTYRQRTGQHYSKLTEERKSNSWTASLEGLNP